VPCCRLAFTQTHRQTDRQTERQTSDLQDSESNAVVVSAMLSTGFLWEFKHQLITVLAYCKHVLHTHRQTDTHIDTNTDRQTNWETDRQDTLNCPKSRSQNFHIRYLEYYERYNVLDTMEVMNWLSTDTMTFDLAWL